MASKTVTMTNPTGLHTRPGGVFVAKAKKGDKVTVDYCERKFVKKIKNSKPGNVIYTNFHTLLIEVQ